LNISEFPSSTTEEFVAALAANRLALHVEPVISAQDGAQTSSIFRVKDLPAHFHDPEQVRRLDSLIRGDMSMFAKVYKQWQMKPSEPIGLSARLFPRLVLALPFSLFPSFFPSPYLSPFCCHVPHIQMRLVSTSFDRSSASRGCWASPTKLVCGFACWI
jgi:hypothetical protein